MEKQSGRRLCLDGEWYYEIYFASGYGIVSLVLHGGQLLAGSGGMLYGLDVQTGGVMWKDNLKGFGCSEISICTNNPFYNLDHNRDTIIQYISGSRTG